MDSVNLSQQAVNVVVYFQCKVQLVFLFFQVIGLEDL